MTRRASHLDQIIAILAVDAGINPWEAREHLTYLDALNILDLLEQRARTR